MKVGETILLPTDITITPHGINCIPYKLTKYKIINVEIDRITLKRGKKIHIKYLDTVKEIINAISNIEIDKTKLPPVSLYSKYLNIASFRFNLTLDECRNKYGLFTINQWESLLQN